MGINFKKDEKFQLISSMEKEVILEEFYEEIEAPKFVDFTLPNHFSPDDCYWFCSRVGCDQKHEEEMDSEAIYKNFVLRVMAARSPNVKFRRAISRKSPSESKKCPFSAPPKPSKSRLPRLALVNSSISKKLLMNEVKGKSKAISADVKAVSTPKARVKHVAAKYMTSPRNKKRSSPNNPNAFRSVRNPKKTSISLPKSKVVAKALVFNSSPKKTLKKKVKDIQLGTPITKLCEGVKKLQINSQKKGIITHKSSKDCISERKKLPSLSKGKPREVDGKFSRSVKSAAKKNDRKRSCSVLQEVEKSGDESSDMEIDEKSRCGSLGLGSKSIKPGIEDNHSSQEEGNSSLERPMTDESSDVVSSITQKTEMNSGSDSDNKVSAEENSEATQAQNLDEQRQEIGLNSANIRCEMNSCSDSDSKVSANESFVELQATSVDEQGQEKENTIADDLENQNPGVVNELTDNDDKENALNSTDIRNLNSENLSKQAAPRKPKVKTKQNLQQLDKTSKENCPAGTSMQVLKNKKLKPTNTKPFRLRTDERRILKEAILERKVNSHENSSTTSENSQGVGNGVSNNREKENKKDEGKSLKKEQLRSIKSRYKTSNEVKPKPEKSSRTAKAPLSQKQLVVPQSREIATPVKSRGLRATETHETTNSRPKEPRKQGKEVVDPTKKVSVAQKPGAQEKRPATIPREPKFHSLHKPKGCTGNKT